MKFGGSSVGTISALTQVISIVLQEQERWDRLILVVSALEGVTDALIEATHLAKLSNRRGYRRITATIRTRHLSLIDELPLSVNERSGLQADVDQLLFDMLNQCQSLSDINNETDMMNKTDEIIGVGEQLTARIIASLLRDNNLRGVAIDSTEIIITDETAGNATPDLSLTNQRIAQHLVPMLERNIVPIVTGFLGGTIEGTPTTLGRGGSDYTASIIGASVGAQEIWMWSIVDGLMSTDPNEVDNAHVIDELSYEEVAELAYFGAKILHARMIGPLKQYNIPLRIKNVFKPQQDGTLIHNAPTQNHHMIKAVTSISGLGLSTNQSGSLSHISAIVDETLFKTIGTHADVMISSQSSSRSFITFVISTTAGPDAVRTSQIALQERLQDEVNLSNWDVDTTAIITIIGSELDRNSGIIAEILHTLDRTQILAYSQGPSRCSFSLVVNTRDSDHILHRIHDFIVNNV